MSRLLAKTMMRTGQFPVRVVRLPKMLGVELGFGGPGAKVPGVPLSDRRRRGMAPMG